MAVQHLMILSIVTLCLGESVQGENGKKYAWDGECGKPVSPPPRKWMSHVSKESHTIVDLAHQYLPPLNSADIARSNRWFAVITGTNNARGGLNVLGALSLVRAKVGHGESDIAIGSAETCFDVKVFMHHQGSGSAKAVFGAYNQDHNLVHTVIIDDCFTLPEHSVLFESMDISIFKFTTTVKFNENIHPVCLPKPNEVLEFGTPGIVVEWGIREVDTSEYSGSLYMMPFKIVNDRDCMERGEPSVDAFCIDSRGNHEEYVRDGIFATVEQGQYVLHGVHTYIRVTDDPSPFWATRISGHLDWIQATITSVSTLYHEERQQS